MRNGFACGIAGVSVLATLVAAEACSSSSSNSAASGEDAAAFSDTTVSADDAGIEDAGPLATSDAGTSTSDAGTFVGLHCATPHCVVALAAGGGHVCALFDDHTLRCWGQNYAGELGIGTIDGGQVTPAQTPTPTLVPGLANVASVAAGGYSNGLGITCATPTDGGVVCWGSNETGGLGLGPADGSAPMQSLVPLPLDLAGVAQLALGGLFSCALTIDGGVSCWGDDTQRQLGRTLEAGAFYDPTPTPVPLPGAATSVATGISHACALLADQSVVCWGAADHGQIGQLLDGGVAMPQTVGGVTATQLSAGEVSTCAITPSGGVSCWGGNQSGQLGRGDAGGDAATDPTARPVGLPAGATAVQLASAAGSTCALLSDHTAWCWGDNAYGELGTGSLTPGSLPTPTPVQGLSNVVQLASGPGGYTVCALLDDSSVRCWGANYADQLGVDTSGDAGTPDESPHPVPLRVTF